MPLVPTDIGAIVLAAGASSRMGSPKLLLNWGEKSVIQHIVHTLNEAHIIKILVVTGWYHDQISSELGSTKAQIIYNTQWKTGKMLSSIKVGLSVLPEKTEAVLICLGDIPGISVEVISSLIATYHQFPNSLIIPEHRGELGHPVLIPHDYWPEIRDLHSPIGLRALMLHHEAMIKRVSVDSPGILLDIDTPEAYQKARKSLLPK